MAGFFRQVAQRALQPTTHLHSAAALPYGSARDAGGDEGTTGLEWSAPAAEKKSVDTAADPLPKILALQREPFATREAATASRASSPPATGKKKSRSVRSPSRKPRPSAKPAKRIEPIPSPLSTEPTRLIAVKGDLSPVAAIKPETARVDAVGHARPAHRRPTRAQVRAAPRSRPASSKKSAASGATNDVHIHIGRVELAAINAPAPAKRATSTEKRPMTLGEYLQHRRSPNAGSS